MSNFSFGFVVWVAVSGCVSFRSTVVQQSSARCRGSLLPSRLANGRGGVPAFWWRCASRCWNATDPPRGNGIQTEGLWSQWRPFGEPSFFREGVRLGDLLPPTGRWSSRRLGWSRGGSSWPFRSLGAPRYPRLSSCFFSSFPRRRCVDVTRWN